MRKTKLFLVLLLALQPFIGWAQNNYNAQHVSIKQTTGDVIQYDLDLNYHGFKPVVKDGKIVWSFLEMTGEIVDGNWVKKEKFAVDNVESIDFRSKEDDETEVRKALIEFYQALDGDNWPHKDNWCSEKPIDEWYGVNSLSGSHVDGGPWVHHLDLTDFFFGQWDYSPGSLPECMQRMGPIRSLRMPSFMLKGSIPDFFGTIYSLTEIGFYGNQLSGTIPESVSKLPHLSSFDIQHNQFEGELPVSIVCNLMDRRCNFNFNNNFFTGKIPEGIRNHPKFANFWPAMMIQRGEGLDLSDLTIPAPVFSATDMNGNDIDLKEVYKNNKYTLLYRWDLAKDYQEPYTKNLVAAYDALKEKGFEIIGLHGGWTNPESKDAEREALLSYSQKNGIHWTNVLYYDWMPSCDLFNWMSLTMLLVDQDGNVVFNDFMDEKGHLPLTYDRCERLFPYLEEHLGEIEYNFYTSTDMTHDGEVISLQKATKGQGIDLVFVGEGYTDKDLEDDEQFNWLMGKALNQFFTYEPYRSMQDRFNVYAVKAVSPNSEFYGNAVHAIDEDVAKAFEYASKVPDLIPNRPMHVCVIYKEDIGKRSYCNLLEDNSFVCYAMDGVSNVLNHEAGGHGFGKLLDEYVEYTGLALPEENKAEMDNQWTTLGWGANIDWRSNPTEVKWAKFINDARYADERIGTYEGSYLYQFGAYRPTENSMMRYNDSPFNAPSREEIYKRVMKESEGESWTYDYETFIAFDAGGHQQFVDNMNINMAPMRRASEVKRDQRTAPPVFLKGTWRDTLKANKK